MLDSQGIVFCSVDKSIAFIEHSLYTEQHIVHIILSGKLNVKFSERRHRFKFNNIRDLIKKQLHWVPGWLRS